jgi:hypothetical protein
MGIHVSILDRLFPIAKAQQTKFIFQKSPADGYSFLTVPSLLNQINAARKRKRVQQNGRIASPKESLILEEN